MKKLKNQAELINPNVSFVTRALASLLFDMQSFGFV